MTKATQRSAAENVTHYERELARVDAQIAGLNDERQRFYKLHQSWSAILEDELRESGGSTASTPNYGAHAEKASAAAVRVAQPPGAGAMPASPRSPRAGSKADRIRSCFLSEQARRGLTMDQIYEHASRVIPGIPRSVVFGTVWRFVKDTGDVEKRGEQYFPGPRLRQEMGVSTN